MMSRKITSLLVVILFVSISILNTELQDAYPLPSLKIKRPSAPNHSKCVVITSINKPTDVIRYLDSQPGWRVVVVGDVKGPQKSSYADLNNTILLDLADQMALGYEILKWTPTHHYARKNIGYLFAIEFGAKTIYETDDDNLMLKPLVIDTSFIMDPLDASNGVTDIRPRKNEIFLADLPISSAQAPVINPYALFGQPRVWPRGFPLNGIQRDDDQVSLSKTQLGDVRPLIQQGLADGDPDVDAIFRLTYFRKPEEKIQIEFDHSAPSVALADGVYAPFNSQNTLFHYEALWALIIPATTNFRVCDIWRGYWAQRLLNEIDGSLTFITSSVYQNRNPHDYSDDFIDELPLYSDVNRLLELLSKWKSQSSESIRDKAIDLSSNMEREGFWKSDDVMMLKSWFRDLERIGYKLPNRGGTTCSHWPDLELFLPVSVGHMKDGELENVFLRSLILFWPLQHANLLVILDSETKDVQKYESSALKSGALLNRIRVKRSDPQPKIYIKGHDRQQWMMFWPDNFTDAEFVGFADTDTLFVSPVQREDLFESGDKPIIQAYFGPPTSNWWGLASDRTHWALGRKQVFMGMSYFPVIIRVRHLVLLREFISRHHGGIHFDAIFSEMRTKGYSQFNVMCNYLWYFHRDEYSWRIQEVPGDWGGKDLPVGQVTGSPSANEVTSDMLIPLGRIAVHLSYHHGGQALLWPLLRAGYCFAEVTRTPNNVSQLCVDVDTSTVFRGMFQFEQTDISRRPAAIEAHQVRQARLKKNNLCDHHWNRKILEEFTTNVKK